MAECLFCRIVAGEIPAKIVKRSEDALAFHDIDAKAPVHLLVIPTRHVSAVRDARGSEGERLLGRVLAFAAEVASEQNLDAAGYRIVTNTGKNAGQSVDHLHLHVLGGRKLSRGLLDNLFRLLTVFGSDKFPNLSRIPALSGLERGEHTNARSRHS